MYANGQLNFNKEERRLFSREGMVLGQLDSYMRKNETGPLTQTIYKIHSKFNVIARTLKLLGKN